jgi:thiamine-monophosphate kinase
MNKTSLLQQQGEFEIIDRYFKKASPSALIGIGDDCAMINIPAEESLLITTDTLIEGRHFLSSISPENLAHRLVAVNFSDIAAMGGQPRYVLLSLSIHDPSHEWLSAFSKTLHQEISRYGAELIGGNTTQGSLSLGLTVMGSTLPSLALRRDKAKVGDDIWVSGYLGGAARGLKILQKRIPFKAHFLPHQQAIAAYEKPEARIFLGLVLRGIASSCIDLSDGLAGDALHIAQLSQVNLHIELTQIPAHPVFETDEMPPHKTDPLLLQDLLAGGDDYELLFTAPPKYRENLERISEQLEIRLTRIGVVSETTGTPKIKWTINNQPIDLALKGFDHFDSKK